MSDDAVIKLRPRDVSVLLTHCLKTSKHLLQVGPPGIGKTHVTHQAVAAYANSINQPLYTWGEGFNPDPPDLPKPGTLFILARPAIEDPMDISGLPDFGEVSGIGRVCRFAPRERVAVARVAMQKGWKVIWFDDDLGQATPAVQASRMALLDTMLPKGVVYIAATNRRTDRAGVSGILEPVKSRFATIVEFEVNVEDWCDWYLDTNGAPEILAFIRNLRPTLLHDFHPTADLSNSPCPRGWANVSTFINAGLSWDIELAAISGCVGKGAASEFMTYLRTWRDLPPLDAIMENPTLMFYERDGAKIPAIPSASNPSARYALVAGLAARTTVKTLGNVLKYAERLLLEAEAGEFAALLLRDLYRRDEALRHTQDFVRVITGPLGKLISGADFETPTVEVKTRKGRK